MQNEKRKALLEHESAKLKECDEALQREMREWKALLMPRKQVLKNYFPNALTESLIVNHA
jgi:STE20-like kinase